MNDDSIIVNTKGGTNMNDDSIIVNAKAGNGVETKTKEA